MTGCGSEEEGVGRFRVKGYLLLKVLKTNFIHSYVIFCGYGKTYFFRLCPLDILRSAFIKTICLALGKVQKVPLNKL